jgi:hypothetical protein
LHRFFSLQKKSISSADVTNKIQISNIIIRLFFCLKEKKLNLKFKILNLFGFKH